MRVFAIALSLLAGATAFTPAAMARPIVFAGEPATGGTLVMPLRNADHLGHADNLLDPATRDSVARALAAAEFDFDRNSVLTLRGIGPWSKIVVIGTGPTPFDARIVQDLGGTAARETSSDNGPVAVLTQTFPSAGPEAGVQLAIGARLGGYSFDKYKFADPAKPKPAGRDAPMTIVTDNAGAGDSYDRFGEPLADGVQFTRDLINEPPNVLYPETFVERAREALQAVDGISIKVLDVPAMEQLGMGSILSVGRGSTRPPRMLIVEYRGAANAPLIALVGKGITFDTGGISLKPGSGMWAMKGDMAGAAAVMGTAISLARSRAPVNIVAIAALAENMPSGSATRPSDVVRAMNGRTIEILSTDAEGRLVLADALVYAERTYRPAAIVDIATLTGAVGTALGEEYAGLFSRNEALAAQLSAAGEATGEELWRLPLHPNYADDMKSDIADIQNVNPGGTPGAGLGAHFVGYFIEHTPWAHLDIAGVDNRSSSLPTVPEGMAGFGVRLLDRFVRDFSAVPADSAAGRE